MGSLYPQRLRWGENEAATPNVTESGVGPSAAELRLPKDLSPIYYNLTVKIYVPGFVDLPPEKNLTFDGALIIKFRVLNPTNKIELNALNLNFTDKLDAFRLLQDGKRPKRANSNSTDGEALIVSSDGTRPVASIPNDDSAGAKSRVDAGLKVKSVVLNETLEKIIFTLDGELQKDQEYYFNIPYSGPITSLLSGLYLTTYNDANGRQRYAAVTQMEPTDCRRFAPIFDEPQMKAIWRLRVLHPLGSRATSNAIETRENETTSDPNWVLTTFDETLPMSSYLVVLVVSDFHFIEGHTKNNVRFRIWARKEALNETQYALQAGIKCLEFYEDYFHIPFPAAQAGHVRVPRLFRRRHGVLAAGGLITYREKYLLYSPQLYNSRAKVHVATVIAHELAHQWFGNLASRQQFLLAILTVTMQWWSDIWLNEGFATLIEYDGTNAISDGKFRMDEWFVSEALSSALDRDARASSHPLYFDITKAEDVGEVFDTISYDKGAAVLRMVRSIMGEKAFKEGVTIYLNRFKFKNAEHKDLWNALNEAVPDSLVDSSGEKFNVNEFAKYFTRQMGYPVIDVIRMDSNTVYVNQTRFKMDENALESPKWPEGKFWYKWIVPLWYSVNGSEKEMKWLHEKTVLEVDESDALVLNSDSKGFYRVRYSRKLMDRINELLLNDHTKLSTKTRARIIDDAFVLAQAGKLQYEVALNLTRYLNKETEFLPWHAAIEGLDSIQFYFGDEPELQEVREYITSMISNLYEKISFDSLNTSYLNDDHFFEQFLDLTIIQKMCQNRNRDCTKKLNEIYAKHLLEPCRGNDQQTSQCSTVPVPLRGLVYCSGVRTGTDKDFDQMLEWYERESVQVERDRLMVALTCSRDSHTLKRLLAMTADFNNTLVRMQDKPSVFESISAQEQMGQQVTFEYFLDHWPQIHRDFKDQLGLLRSMIIGSIGGSSERTIEQVERFLRENENTRKFDVFQQRLEVLKTNVKWKQENFAPLAHWFKRQNEQRRAQQAAAAA
ncbi:Aminopeptidase N [Aphelenchoides fujianensis]|nr:Aminopeptidase N [Aphelenchoides fujianensis]